MEQHKCEKCDNYLKVDNESLILRSVYTRLPCFVGTFQSPHEVTLIPQLRNINYQYFLVEFFSICRSFTCCELCIIMKDQYGILSIIGLKIVLNNASLSIVLDTTQPLKTRLCIMQLLLDSTVMRRKFISTGYNCFNHLSPYLINTGLYTRPIFTRERFCNLSLYKLCLREVNIIFGFRRDIIHNTRNLPSSIVRDLKHFLYINDKI